MTKKTRRRIDAALKAKIALEALPEESTLADLAALPERLWRSLKHENVYLMGYADGSEARAGIRRWIDLYNQQRPHQALGYARPMALWRGGQIAKTGAAGCGHVDNADALPTGPQQQQQQHAMAA